MPDSGPPQCQRLEAAVPQALVTIQAGGGGGSPTSDPHRETVVHASQPVSVLEAEGEHLSLLLGLMPLKLSGHIAGWPLGSGSSLSSECGGEFQPEGGGV